jgi:putative redox protein
MSITVEVSFPGGKKVDGHINGFTVHTDQNVESGGEGSAPEPFDLFFVSLATCAGIYAVEFCRSRDIKTEGLDMRLHADKSDSSNLFDRISLFLTLPEGFPEKYRGAIVRAVNLCTVKRYIRGEVKFDTRIVE